jgi:hypothetical protein
MRKILLVVIVVIFFSQANAQKGSALVYGSIEYQSQKTVSGIKQNAFEFVPGVGYQFNKNWTVGVTGNISSTKFTPMPGLWDHLYVIHFYCLIFFPFMANWTGDI